MVHRIRWASVAAAAALAAGGLTLVATPQAQAADWSRCLTGPTDRQAVFDRAAPRSGVPVRCCSASPTWSRAGTTTAAGRARPAATARCTSPGRGRGAARELAMAKGDGGTRPAARDAARLHAQAAEITGIGRGPAALRRRSPTSAAARPCWRRTSATARPSARPSATGAEAVGSLQPARPTTRTRCDFATQVFAVDPLRRVPHHERRPAGHPARRRRAPASTRPPCARRRSRPATTVVDCPAALGCEWLPGAVRAVRLDARASTATTTSPTGRTTG